MYPPVHYLVIEIQQVDHGAVGQGCVDRRGAQAHAHDGAFAVAPHLLREAGESQGLRLGGPRQSHGGGVEHHVLGDAYHLPG